MASLDSRLKSLETRSQAARFPWADRAKAWDLMVDRARLKLCGLHPLLQKIPEPSAAWLVELRRDVASEDREDIGMAREKLYAKFPAHRESLEALTDVEIYALRWDWPTWARQSQIPPGSDQVSLEALLDFYVSPSQTESTTETHP